MRVRLCYYLRYMYRWAICLSVFALSLFSVTGIFAQETSCISRIVPITVLDSHGHVIHGLLSSDFTAKIHGRPARILSVSLDKRPHRVVVLLDESGSMGVSDGRPWEVAREIASHIAESKLENTSLALMIYSDKVHEQVDFVQGSAAVLARLREISADSSYIKKNVRGRTATYDAILSASRLLDASDSSDSIYLISDGDENQSRFKSGDVAHALGPRSVRLHVTLLSKAPIMGFGNRVPEEGDSIETITSLASDSGGLVVSPVGARSPNGTNYNVTNDQFKTLSVALTRLYVAITNDELLEIELPQTIQKWERLSLELSPERKNLHKDLRIAYPKELAPCSALSHYLAPR